MCEGSRVSPIYQVAALGLTRRSWVSGDTRILPLGWVVGEVVCPVVKNMAKGGVSTPIFRHTQVSHHARVVRGGLQSSVLLCLV